LGSNPVKVVLPAPKWILTKAQDLVEQHHNLAVSGTGTDLG
jgi:hypothetical protein